MELIQLLMIEDKKKKRTHSTEEVKCLYKEFGLPAGMMKGLLAKWENKK